MEAADLTSTTTGLDLDSMLDRSDSDLSTTDARTIRKQLEGLENMYSEVSAIHFNKVTIVFFSIALYSTNVKGKLYRAFYVLDDEYAFY